MAARKIETLPAGDHGHIRGHGCRDLLVYCGSGRCHHSASSKYPPAEPGALVLEPLEAACPCCFNSAALLRRGMSQHHVSVTISLTSSLGRQRLHNCITAPRSGASAFKPSIDAIPFVCLAVGRVAAIEPGGVDPRICQTFAASPAEPGELPLWFSRRYFAPPPFRKRNGSKREMPVSVYVGSDQLRTCRRLSSRSDVLCRSPALNALSVLPLYGAAIGT